MRRETVEKGETPQYVKRLMDKGEPTPQKHQTSTPWDHKIQNISIREI